MNKTGIIYGINGPVIYLKGDSGFKISEMVYVGKDHLVGEVIGLKKGMTTIQVFEETTGLRPGETVIGTGDAISVLLGPGIIHNIFDGIQRPLEEIAKASGKYISRGVSVDSLDTEKKWNTHIIVKEGDVVGPGSVIAETQETDSILHKSMVPPNLTEATVIHAASDGVSLIRLIRRGSASWKYFPPRTTTTKSERLTMRSSKKSGREPPAATMFLR